MTLTRRAGALLVASGFAAGVTQVLLIRELLQACFGTEVSLGLMLAAWLVCGAVGTLAAAWWRPREPTIARTAGRALKLAGLLAPAVFAAISFARLYTLLANVIPLRLAEVFAEHKIISRVLAIHVAVQPGEMLGPLHLALISFGTALLPALLAGALFAVCLKLYEQAREGDAASPGQAYALDAVGHLVGGVLLGWAAATMLNPFAAACAAAGLLWFAAAAVARGAEARIGVLPAAGALVVIALLAGSFSAHRLTSQVRWRGHDLLDEVSSLYGHIAVARHGQEGVIFFENGVPTGMSPALPSVEQFVQFAMLQHLRPRRVLMIGGGATGGLLEALKHDPEEIEYLELDPALLRFAEQWVTGPDRAALRDPRVTSLAADGRLRVKQAAAGHVPKYDVIISLLPDPSTALLNRFYTEGWFREAREALNPGGVLAWEMSSSRHYMRPSLMMLNTSILQAAEPAFPRKALMTGDETLAVAMGDEQAALSDDAATLLERMEARDVEAPLFAAVARDRLDPYNKRYVLEMLRESPPVATNDDLTPVAYYYEQAGWMGYYAPGIEDFYVRLGRLQLRDLALPGAVVLAALLLIGAHRRGRAGYVPLAILVTGALGMALQLCLLFAFQSYYGYVYRLVGVIIGAFMVGLAGGAMLAAGATRRASQPRLAAWALAGTQVLIALFALALPTILGALAGERHIVALSPLTALLGFPLLTAVVGMGVGVQFPLATATAAWGARNREAGAGQARTAAGLYAADLIGASVGAATMGAVLIPVLGIPQTCLAAAALSAGMAVLLVLRAASRS